MKVNTTTIEDRSNGLERETDVSKKESHDSLFEIIKINKLLSPYNFKQCLVIKNCKD